METTVEEVKEWYAKERNITVAEFDEYDLHVCRVAQGFANYVTSDSRPKFTFNYIGGYECMKDGTKSKTLHTLEEVQDHLDDFDIEYDRSISDVKKLVESVIEEWEEMFDDGGGRGWIDIK